MLDTEIYGRRAGGYHLTNLLLHAASAAVLFIALKMATGKRLQSGFVAALFALHPLHVESVAWVAERKDVLSTLFGLLSLLTYFHYAMTERRQAYAASLILFLCSLLAKQSLVTLPFVFLLLDFWPLRRPPLRRLAVTWPAVTSPAVTSPVDGRWGGARKFRTSAPDVRSSAGQLAPPPR